ncbi:hypothetical protein H113_01262 [Trichophyton rubrum MR1459]|uniref:Uncharacterized protein n=1 Tax=Trichophyton rubrum (strain ATCC MYA-4607 / CBS 118892) TaxID=559305 RepID=A0A080WR30_TRIRC|nr:uncharacterized protein TERG_12579 [Trichophyton rubrum CBS 118892]EZF99023.1 hypothetical protein H113_01262 [Trichophyton rubrum MR1459]EZG10081.1 hypothetical protein H106_01058 [Trichophyton rubrum CBS 735.88]KFL62800.1 hypothetical protein TERG_12579 [Trichophyton rubrum CBS 118892]
MKQMEQQTYTSPPARAEAEYLSENRVSSLVRIQWFGPLHHPHHRHHQPQLVLDYPWLGSHSFSQGGCRWPTQYLLWGCVWVGWYRPLASLNLNNADKMIYREGERVRCGLVRKPDRLERLFLVKERRGAHWRSLTPPSHCLSCSCRETQLIFQS